MSYKVVVTSRSFSKASPEPLEYLKAHGCEVEFRPNPAPQDEKKVAELLGDAEGAIVGDDIIGEYVLSHCPDLRVISKHGVGVDSIDLRAAKERGVKVTRVLGANHESVADLVLSFLLALSRNLLEVSQECKRGNWGKAKLSQELFEKTVGIIGLGRVGKAVARRLQGFSCNILAYDPYVQEGPEYVKFVDLDTLLKEADFVTCHASLNKDNHKFLGKREFSLMKESAFFINTARGELVEEDALAEALRLGKIKGAALDVFYHEPLINSPLLELPNVIVTPHVASHTVEANTRLGKIAAENLVRVLEGKEPLFEA